ncbi:MAG: alpha/beta hydrolase [Oscillospiraceae bacterium]|nr:alpha/beta hydrolase [Oscillospiraceae bacterium]
MENQDKRKNHNQNLMKLVKALHDLTICEDLQKQRRSQEKLGKLFGTKNSEAAYTEFAADTISCEWVRPARPHQTSDMILYCHGGGFCTGSLKYARTLTTKLALAASMDVLSFNYRLAPEHPAPAALEDALKVWDYLMLLGYDAKNITVCGDSAGGNLALVLGLKLKEERRALPRSFVLFSPWTDLTLTSPSHAEKAELDPILTMEYLKSAREAYVPEGISKEAVYKNPDVSPLFGDHTGFPPVYIQAGSNEILLDDSAGLQKKLAKQHVSAKIDIYEGMWHVFQMSNMKTANRAICQAVQFILDA